MSVELGKAYIPIEGNFGPFNKQFVGFGRQLTSKMGKLGKVAGVGFGATALGAGLAGKALYEVGKQFDASYDKIRIGTGATGKHLKGLEGDFKNVVSSVPTDFGNASTAIAGLNSRLGLTGKPLRRVAKDVLELSRMTETDLGTNVASTTRLFKDWSIQTGKQPAALDEVFRASQATGIQVGKLAEDMVKFGSPLRQLGFNFDTTAAMFSKFEAEGVNMQTAMPGLRMALKHFSEEGKDPAAALKQTGEAIKNAASTAEANTLAFKVFGTRAGPDLAAAFREGRFNFGSLIKTIHGGKDTILGASHDTQDFAEKWLMFKNRVMVALEPVARRVFGTVGRAMSRIGAILTSKKLDAGEKFSKLMDMAAKAIQAAIPKVAGIAAQAAPKVAVAFVKGFLNTPIWGKLAIGGFLLAKFGGAGPFQKLGTKMGRTLGVGVMAGFGVIELAKLLQEELADDLTGTSREEFASKLQGMFKVPVGAIKFAGTDKVKVATGLGDLIFSTKTERVVAARGKKLQQLVGKIPETLLPKFDKLREIDRMFGDALKPLPGKAERTATGINRALLPKLDQLVNQGGHKAEAFRGRVGGPFKGLAGDARSAMQNIGDNVSEEMRALGVAKVSKFSLKKLVASLPELKPIGKQRGGPIHLGASSGDTVPAMLERGEYVLNRKAVAALGIQHLDALNFAHVPRFQKGGSLGPEPRIIGPDPLRSLGQGAIHKVFAAGQKYIAAHRPKGGVGPSSGPSGTAMFDGMAVAKWTIPELMWARKHGWSGQVTSGWRDPSQVVHGAFATAPQGQSEHQYTHYPGGAVDLSDYGQFAQIIKGYRGPRKLIQLGIDPLHFSGTGHRLGGLIQRLAKGGLVGATTFGGPGDPSTGHIGYRGDDLRGKMAFAELDMGKALGDLAYKTALKIARAGKSVIARKLDIGAGGGPIAGLPRKIDLWYQTAEALGLPNVWSGAVSISGPTGGSTGSTSKPAIKKQSPYSEKGGVTGAGGGTRAPAHGESPTAKLPDFGSPPTTLPACRRELAQRRTERSHYRASWRKAKDPAEKQALRVNIDLLSARIEQLRKLQVRLVRSEAIKKAIKKISEVANFAYWTKPNTGIFAERENAYNELQEFAQQAVELEPEEPAGGTTGDWVNNTLKPYVEGTESPAYARVLSSEEGWRGAIIGAEQFAEGKIGDWGVGITKLKERIAEIQGLKGSPAYAKQAGLIPGIRQKIKALWADITKTRNETLPEWEDALGGVQGMGRTHQIVPLTGEPSGQFGGDIFDTQMTIKGLGLKVPQALSGLSGGEDNSARREAVEQLLREANQRAIVLGIEKSVFAGMPKPGGLQIGGLVKVMPPYAGKAHTGAIVPGPPTQERTMVVKGGEGIFTTEQLAAMGGDGGSVGDVKVHVHGDIVSSHPDPVQVLIGDKRFHAEVRKVTEHDNRRTARGAGRRLPGRAGVFGG